ncbi:ArgR family transcriptional regulator [Streptococcus sciuri]|uniref:Arginine repressor n=1 Tax=Streptococcus sciuri TaxID=2973939 RepID=A0ABT2F6G2_9STRE|nr:ArgR family transcriptional regulator [Streptococcus sciuri]MCS4488080.1 ArgR family transcriptional regulator [Streptococcus sciuri]
MMRKKERLKMIKELITTEVIETQQELLNLLEKRGMHLTQATISRDMNEIGIIKVPSDLGHYIYGFSEEVETPSEQAVTKETNPIVSVSNVIAGEVFFLTVDVIPGNSRVLKTRLKRHFTSDLLSVIADDDSLLLLVKEKEVVEKVQKALSEWMLDKS